MNRHQRRAAMKQPRSQKHGLSKVIAVHEAGHAVARYITAEDLGFEAEEAIRYIEIAFVPLGRASLDDKATLSSSAMTVGPTYSMPMHNHLKINPVPQHMGAARPITIQAAVDACKAAGIDVVSWAALKAFISVAGAAAEAKFTGRPLGEIINNYECEIDLRDAMTWCLLAGMSAAEAGNVVENMLNYAETVFADPRHWCAVLALADRLPAAGRMQGKRAAAIIHDALAVASSVRPPAQGGIGEVEAP